MPSSLPSSTLSAQPRSQPQHQASAAAAADAAAALPWASGLTFAKVVRKLLPKGLGAVLRCLGGPAAAPLPPPQEACSGAGGGGRTKVLGHAATQRNAAARYMHPTVGLHALHCRPFARHQPLPPAASRMAAMPPATPPAMAPAALEELLAAGGST